jgi:Lipoprotein LpqB beta-propeller domain/Sporulation and spore germination
VTSHGRGRPRLLVAALVCVMGLTACAEIPNAGSVQHGDVSVEESGTVYNQPYGPPADAEPREIVNGFLKAQSAGISEDWSTAREYLADKAKKTWEPTARTIIFTGDIDVSQVLGPDDATSPGTTTPGSSQSAPEEPEATTAAFSGRAQVTSTLDSDGRYTEESTGTTQDLTFTLEKDADGQWRITATEDGIFVSEPNFKTGFRATTLYFPTNDDKFLVPEVRWYSATNTAAHAVKGVLAGPSEWLRDSVHVVAPEGTELVLDSVPIDNFGTAKVDLTQSVLSASDEDIAMLRAQLDAVLLKVSGVSAVEITVNSTPLDFKTSVSPIRDPVPITSSPLVLAEGVVSVIDGSTATPVPGLLTLEGKNVTAIAADAGLSLVVYRSAATTIATVPTESDESVVILSGQALLAPSVDRFGWIWSGESGVGAPLKAVSAGGDVIEIVADWLAGRRVESIRVSRDGARIAIVSSAGAVSRVDVAAIARDDTDAPLRLSAESIAVGASVTGAREVVWIDESTVGVLADGQTSDVLTVHVVPLSEHSEALSGVDGTVSLAAGRGRRAVFVATAEGELKSRATTGAAWSNVASDVSIPTFPG